MKKFILLLASLVLTGTMMARQLTPDEALALALGKMNLAQPELTRAQSVSTNATRASLTHTEVNGQDEPLYYVFDMTEGGFIIASADDRAPGLLGYTDSGDFEGAKQNQTFLAWLKDCRKALTRIGSMPEEYRSASAGTRAQTASVSPLLGEIKWNQGAPYNLLTPLRVGKRDEKAEPDTVHAPTGCVATALAQVMMYYQWPVTGTGSHINTKDSLQSVDFTQSTYQWSKMLPEYKGGESEESKMAVAQLMSDVGCALDMDYGYNSSGTLDEDVPKALAYHFGYDKSMRLVYRSEVSSEEWNDMLINELNEKRPVIFGAMAASGGGHEFVIDGYDANGLYHVNWGWSGAANGYFDINLMDPDFQGIGGYDGGYTIKQVMTLGVKPDREGTSVAKPELVMTRHIMFDQESQQWIYRVSNYGLGDFTGEAGIAMESPTGEVTKPVTFTYDAEPIVFYKNIEYSFEAPNVPGPGYKLYPYYCDEVGGEMKRIPAPYNGFSALYSVEEEGEIGWTFDKTDVADFRIVNFEVKHNYVGFDPQFNITVNNAAESLKEYTGDIIIDIYTMVDGENKLVCKGWAQAFIKPGETKELVVRCNQVKEEFKEKILAGEYNYYVFFCTGGNYYLKVSGSFDMVDVPASDITYSEFAVDKTELQPGEELTASMKVTNTGGYDVRTLAFVIQRQTDKAITIVEMRNVDIEPDSSETFTFKKVLPSTPDEYIAAFFVNGKQLSGAPVFKITVANPTALDKVESASVNDGKSGIYDLQGRPVEQMQKGGIYIGKGKFVVK